MRGKNFSDAERTAIRLLLSRGHSRRFIAQALKRSVAGVQGQIEAMRANGTIDQLVLDMGQADERE